MLSMIRVSSGVFVTLAIAATAGAQPFWVRPLVLPDQEPHNFHSIGGFSASEAGVCFLAVIVVPMWLGLRRWRAMEF